MLNFELRIGLAQGWQYTIHPRASPFHFLLFTFNFPKGPLFTFHFSLFTSRRDTFHFHNALRCDARCSVLHRLLQCTAFVIAPHCVFRPIVVRVPAQHFSLCTFHSSLISCSALRFPTYCCQSLRAAFFPLSSGVFL